MIWLGKGFGYYSFKSSDYRLLWSTIVLQLLLNAPTISQCPPSEHLLVFSLILNFKISKTWVYNIQNLHSIPTLFSPTMCKYCSSTWIKFHPTKTICSPNGWIFFLDVARIFLVTHGMKLTSSLFTTHKFTC